MKIPVHNFDLGDVLNLATPLVQQTTQTIGNANTAINSLQPDIDFVNRYWPEILIGLFIAMIVADVIANKING